MSGPPATWPRDKFAVDLTRVGWSAPNAFLQGLTALPSYLEVPILSSDQNDFNPPGFDTHPYVSLSSSVDISITGFVSVQQGELKFIINRGPNNITLVSNSNLSLAQNRIASAASLTLSPNEGMLLIQDPIADRWRFISNGVTEIDGRIPYPTLTEALNDVPLGATFFQTAAYAETGDGGGALYTSIAAPGSPAAGQYQSALGEWFEVVGPILTLEQFGARGHVTTRAGVNISNISIANPAVVTTATPHGFSTGNFIYIQSVAGMVQINSRIYEITVLSATTFSLQFLDSTNVNTTSNYNSYTSGGTANLVYDDTDAFLDCKECAQRLRMPQYWHSSYLIEPGRWEWIAGDATSHGPGPVILTGSGVTIFSLPVDSPIFRIAKPAINNFRFVKGGLIGALNFIDTNRDVASTNRHCFSIGGTEGFTFEKLFAINPRGSLIFVENRFFNNISDYYHNYGHSFRGLTVIVDLGLGDDIWALNNAQVGQGFSGCIIDNIYTQRCGGWKGFGAAIQVPGIASVSWGPGYALDFDDNTSTLFRGFIDTSEFDAPEDGIRISAVEGLSIRYGRTNVRPGGSVNLPFIPQGESWPKIGVTFGKTGSSRATRNNNIGMLFRVQTPMNQLPPLLDFQNDINLSNIVADITIQDTNVPLAISTVTNSPTTPGRYRLTLATATPLLDYGSGIVGTVSGVTGATGVNGTWTMDVMGPNILDLRNTTYVSDGTGGTVAWGLGALADNCPTGITVSGAVAAGNGEIVLTVSDTRNLIEGLAYRIANVGGTVEANGVWVIAKLTNTTLQLIGSVFVNAYTSGGVLIHPYIQNLSTAVTARIIKNGEIIYDTLQKQLAVASGVSVTISNAVNSGGNILLTVSSTANLFTGMRVSVTGVRGVPNANGNFTITVVSATTVLLQSSVWAGSYSSGGILRTSIASASYGAALSKVWFSSERQDSPGNFYPNLGAFVIPYPGTLRARAQINIPAYLGMSVRLGIAYERAGTFNIIEDASYRGIGDGTADRTINGITNADPAVVTCSATHNLAAGTIIHISGVSTMVEVNNRFWMVGSPSGANFNLQYLDGSNFNASGLSAGTGGTVKVAPETTFEVNYFGNDFIQGDYICVMAIQGSGNDTVITLGNNLAASNRFEMSMVS